MDAVAIGSGADDEVSATMTLDVRTVGGTNLMFQPVPCMESALGVKARAATILGTHAAALCLVGPQGEVGDFVLAAELALKPLTVVLASRVAPFVERLTAPGSCVIVDGIPAIFSYSQGGWGSSEKIRFVFSDGNRHPQLGTSFQTKYWTNPSPGVIAWGHGNERLKVEQILPATEDTQAQPCTWVISGLSALVRAEPGLDSRELGRLTRDTSVTVVEGRTLEDADATPRLRLAQPVAGWITPYLASSSILVARPSDEVIAHYASPSSSADEALGRIVRALAKELL